MHIEGVRVFDNVVVDPVGYRAKALELEFKSQYFEDCTFHGIALDSAWELPVIITSLIPKSRPIISFYRKSPHGQVEPHYIHTDIDMGVWSALLYLNVNPPDGDGTTFWTHNVDGVGSDVPHVRSLEGRKPDTGVWTIRGKVDAKLNRLVVFDSRLFHSRSIYDNWGSGSKARLTQVVFGDYHI